MFSYTDMLILASNLDDDCTTTEDEGTVDDREACPGCGCKPGEGYTCGCKACQETQDTLAGGHDSGEECKGDEKGSKTMKINTENYEATHGRKPRGEGAWMFLIGGRPGESTEFSATGSYGEACRLVKIEAKQIGRASSITLCD